MKGLKLVLFILIYKAVVMSCAASNRTSLLVSHAIKSVLVEYFARNSAKVDVVFYGESENLNESIIREIFISISNSISFQTSTDGADNNLRRQLNTSSVFLFESR